MTGKIFGLTPGIFIQPLVTRYVITAERFEMERQVKLYDSNIVKTLCTHQVEGTHWQLIGLFLVRTDYRL